MRYLSAMIWLLLLMLVACGGTAVEQPPATAEPVSTATVVAALRPVATVNNNTPPPATPLAGYPITNTNESASGVTATGNTTGSATAVVPPPTLTVDPQAVFSEEAPTQTTAEEVLRLIFEDLRRQFDIAGGDIEIEEVFAGSWPSRAVGCCEPGIVYEPVITPGYMVTLVVGYDLYIYHTDDALTVLLCTQPDRETITPAPNVNR